MHFKVWEIHRCLRSRIEILFGCIRSLQRRTISEPIMEQITPHYATLATKLNPFFSIMFKIKRESHHLHRPTHLAGFFLCGTQHCFLMQAADLASPGTCQRLVDVTTRGEEDEEGEGIVWGGGVGGHRALLMGTQCAERQEAAHSSRQRCHHRGRDKVGGRERERGREGGRFYFSPILFIGYQWWAHRHTRTKGTRTDWHTCMVYVEARKWARHTFTPTSTRVAWLSESSKSQASIQFIREPLAAVLV